MRLLALFGPTAVGKTGVAIEVAALLRERGEDPVAISCDAMQVYRGLEIISGAPTAAEQERLEHRLVSFVPIDGEFSAGRFATLAHAEIDQLIAEDRRPILVGGTGLYMRAALSELDMRPPVPDDIRWQVEREVEERGAQALHEELDPDLAATTHPNDGKRIIRLVGLQRAGVVPHKTSSGLWSEGLRRPTTLIGLTTDPEDLRARIDARVDEMVRLGAEDEVRSADAAGASQTARYAIGFEELQRGDVEATKTAQWQFARRQLVWMRRMEDVTRIDRGGRSDADVAAEIAGVLGQSG